ncbi:MAG: hypothetical protein KAT43_03640 [Nanoarchaeota archaeon]|nr:hypothetical protein [Nanoarchaeota archaeon]
MKVNVHNTKQSLRANTRVKKTRFNDHNNDRAERAMHFDSYCCVPLVLSSTSEAKSMHIPQKIRKLHLAAIAKYAMQRITLSPYQFPKRLGVQLVAQAVSSPRLGQWVVPFFYNLGGIDEKDDLA